MGNWVTWIGPTFAVVVAAYFFYDSFRWQVRTNRILDEIYNRPTPLVWITLGDDLSIDVNTKLDPSDTAFYLRAALGQIERSASTDQGAGSEA